MVFWRRLALRRIRLSLLGFSCRTMCGMGTSVVEEADVGMMAAADRIRLRRSRIYGDRQVHMRGQKHLWRHLPLLISQRKLHKVCVSFFSPVSKEPMIGNTFLLLHILSVQLDAMREDSHIMCFLCTDLHLISHINPLHANTLKLYN